MTDKAVSALTSLTGANTATGDLLYIVDISEAAAADRSKKITIQEAFKGVPAGAEATPSLAAQGDQDTGIWFPTANTLALSTGGTERVRVDSSGNLGLGVTPSAWSGVSGGVFEIKGNAYIYSTTGVLSSGANAFFNGTNWIYKTTQAATRYEQVNGQHQWGIAPSGTAGNAITFTQAMTLDASGRLMIGPTSTTYRLDVDSGAANTAIFRSTGGNPQITATDGTVTQFSGYTGGGVAYAGTSSNHPFAVLTNNTERARITSGGDLLVGGHSAAVFGEKFSLVAGAQNGALFKNTAQPSNVALFWNASTTGDAQFCAFATETSYTSRGTISYNRAGGLVAYNTTSDYRAKDIIGPITNSGATIDALKVYEGVMKGATQSRPMLVAHEAQAVAPYAVTGEKDAVNEDGDPIYQQMDVSSLVPLLLAEIQSLRARVAALEAN